MIQNCKHCIAGKKSPFLCLLPHEMDIFNNGKIIKNFKKGDIIFNQGEKINGVFCIRKGVCKMIKLVPNGNEQVVKLASEGALLGQRSMISDEKAGLSAVAKDEMDVCFIPKEAMLFFFANNNEFFMNVTKNICNDLRQVNNHLVDMSQKSVRQRLASTLLNFRDTFGTEADGSLKIKISREELSGIIGTATESCIRLLSDLQKRGMIKLSGRKIILSDTSGLQKESGQI